jgi:sugar diacid utilization regulator
MTGGIVSIEDTASRVLAYSGSDDQVDTLRRLSILGRRGPEPYLAMLREWGVYQRLWSSEEVVDVDEHPELGIRRRMAVGIHAGAKPLGTIWVQEGAAPLAQRCRQVLLGAARVAAPQLIRQRSVATAAPLRENLLTGLLDGRVDVDSVADAIGADPAKPGLVVAFTLRTREQDRSEFELRQAELTNLVSVHTAAYRRTAMVTSLGSRVYVLLPDLPDFSAASALVLTREIVATARTDLRVDVRAGVGSAVPALSDIAASRIEADRILDATAHDPGTDIAAIGDVRAKVLVNEALTMLRDNERFRDARIEALAKHDAEHGSLLVLSLLAYLEAFGDVREASEFLHIHPNTLRYRVRRAGEVSGIDLSQPTERLNAHLQLLLQR